VNGPVRSVAFDIDDTLYLERDYVRSGFEAVSQWIQERRGVKGFAGVAIAEFDRGTRGVIFDRALASLRVQADRALIEAMVREYREHMPSIRLLPDAEAALGALFGRMKLAVVSDGPVASQHAKARALALGKWCEPIVFTEALGLGFGKPHLRAFEMVEERTGAAGCSCAYVADNPAKDFGGPKTLGWRTIRVRHEGGLHATVASGPDVDMEICDLSSLATFLKEIP